MRWRALALGLLLAGVALCWLGIIEPWRAANRDLGRQIEAAERELVLLRSEAAALPELQRHAAALPGSAAEEDYLTGESETIVLADLQDRVRAAARRLGGLASSTNVLAPVEAAGGPRKVGVQIELQIGTAGLRELLYELESGRPLLLVENLELRARSARDATAGEPRLDMRFDLVGYMRAETP